MLTRRDARIADTLILATRVVCCVMAGLALAGIVGGWSR